MPCYKPLDGWRAKAPHPSGRRGVVFNAREAALDEPITVPCGQCIGCRLERSRQWAMRCVHEASQHERNCFITLTYNNENLPRSGSLDVREFQLFMKRLRKRFGDGIRFFHCGEYGAEFGRPHYHACLFNFDFDDKVLWSERDGIKLYVSEALQELWGDDKGPFGFCTVGDVTFESAAYVARYIMKKVTGDDAPDHYGYTKQIVIEDGCEIEKTVLKRKPEYITMSRRPGIGRDWYDNFFSDVYPSDFVVMNGKKMKPPKYYDSLFEIDDPDGFDRIKRERKQKAGEHEENNSSPRLLVREECQLRRLKLLKRSYENE